jgi:hypothetical protein
MRVEAYDRDSLSFSPIGTAEIPLDEKEGYHDWLPLTRDGESRGDILLSVMITRPSIPTETPPVGRKKASERLYDGPLAGDRPTVSPSSSSDSTSTSSTGPQAAGYDARYPLECLIFSKLDAHWFALTDQIVLNHYWQY